MPRSTSFLLRAASQAAQASGRCLAISSTWERKQQGPNAGEEGEGRVLPPCIVALALLLVWRAAAAAALLLLLLLPLLQAADSAAATGCCCCCRLHAATACRRHAAAACACTLLSCAHLAPHRLRHFRADVARLVIVAAVAHADTVIVLVARVASDHMLSTHSTAPAAMVTQLKAVKGAVVGHANGVCMRAPITCTRCAQLLCCPRAPSCAVQPAANACSAACIGTQSMQACTRASHACAPACAAGTPWERAWCRNWRRPRTCALPCTPRSQARTRRHRRRLPVDSAERHGVAAGISASNCRRCC